MVSANLVVALDAMPVSLLVSVVLVVLHASSVALAIYMDARKLGKHLVKEVLSVFEFIADLAEGAYA